MAVPYVNIGDLPGAAQVNALNQAADAKLANLFSGLPPVLWGGGFARRFYFFNAIPAGPPFANVAQAYIYWCSQNPTQAPWLRQYDHTPFTNCVAAATLATVTAGDPRPVADGGYPCARVTGAAPTLTWLNSPVGTQPAQTLLGSLEAHQKNFTVDLVTVADFTVPSIGSTVTVWVNSGNLVNVADALVLDSGDYTVATRAGNQLTLTYNGSAANGTCVSGTAVMRGGTQVSQTADYYVYFDGDLVAEHAELFQPIDVIFGNGVGASFDWPANWNKYGFIRFNNLQNIDMVVNFAPAGYYGTGGLPVAVGVPAMRSTPIRRVTTNMWDINSMGVAYFFKLYANDPLFLHLPPHDGQPDHTDQSNNGWGSPATDFMCQARMLLQNAPNTLAMDWTQFWDMTSTYCGAGKLFGDLSSGAMVLTDALVHVGKLIVVDVDSENDLLPQTQDITVRPLPDTEILVMASGANALGVTGVAVTRGGISIPSSGNWSVAAISGGYTITFETGGVINAGDAVVVTFQSYRREPLFTVCNYTGINNLAAAFSGTVVTVTNPSPANAAAFRLSSTKNVDVLGIGTNLLGIASPDGTANKLSISAGGYADIVPGFGTTAAPTWNVTAPHFTHASNVETASWTDLATGNPMSVNVNVTQVTSDGGTTVASLTPFSTILTIENAVGGMGGDVNGATPGSALSVSFKMSPAGPYGAMAMSITAAAAHSDLAKYFTLNNDGTMTQTVALAFPLSNFTSTQRSQTNLSAALAPGHYNAGAFPDMSQTALEVSWPRAQQRWLTGRVAQRSAENEPFSKQTADWTTVDESPLVKNWYELKPFAAPGALTSVLIPETNSNVFIETLGYRLAEFLYWAPEGSLLHAIDGMLAASAFFNYEHWGYADASTGTVYTYDFTAGSKDRAGFYDGMWYQPQAWGRYALPIQAEHYNLVAGIVNGATGDFGAPQLPAGVAEVLPPFTIGGGISGYRPRTQFCHWNHSDANAAQIEAFWTSFGITIRTSADFVAYDQTGATITFASIMASNVLFVSDETTLATSETPPGLSTPVPLWNMAPYFLNGSDSTVTNDYRWITITDAQTVYAALKIPFVFQELGIPLKLIMSNAILSHAPTGVTGGPLDYGYPIARLANWLCDQNGEWVIDATDPTMTLDSWTNLPVIRSDDSKCDYCIQDVTVTDFGGLESLFWAVGGYFFRQCQGLKGHKAYIYRRYGAPPAQAAIFGCNYADFQPRNGEYPGNGLTYVPRTAVTGLDGQRQTIDCAGDETVITTTLENAILLIWPGPRAI